MFAAVLASGAACGAAPKGGAAGDPGAAAKETTVKAGRLPINQRFRNLDEYLAYLRKHQAPVDGPWYKEIRPGVFELQTGNLRILGEDGREKKTFTREELERKFGFTR